MSRKATVSPQMTGRNKGVHLRVESEDHDLSLLRSIADAVRTNPEVVDPLTRYAEVRLGLDADELEGRRNANHRLAMEDEAADLLGEIERDTDPFGEGLSLYLNRDEALALYHALGDALMDSQSVEELRRSA